MCFALPNNIHITGYFSIDIKPVCMDGQTKREENDWLAVLYEPNANTKAIAYGLHELASHLTWRCAVAIMFRPM